MKDVFVSSVSHHIKYNGGVFVVMETFFFGFICIYQSAKLQALVQALSA